MIHSKIDLLICDDILILTEGILFLLLHNIITDLQHLGSPILYTHSPCDRMKFCQKVDSKEDTLWHFFRLIFSIESSMVSLFFSSSNKTRDLWSDYNRGGIRLGYTVARA